MKADAKPTIEEVARLLYNGTAPDWVIDRLRQNAPLVGYHTGAVGDDVERSLFESALRLRDGLQIYVRAAEMMVGGEYPPCIDAVTTELEELIPFLAKGVDQRKDGRPTDARLRLCAAVCLSIWKEVRGVEQPYAPKLWAACEAYWVVCGHPSKASGNVKRWAAHLLASTTR
jgi:hypothetical protein